MPHAVSVWVLVTCVVFLTLSSSPSVGGATVFVGTPPPEEANATAAKINKFNVTIADKDDWYVADHPFFYEMDKVRAPNGSWVKNPNATFPPFTIEEWRNNTMERVPWWIRWYVTGETRELRKEMIAKRKLIMDHVVSPMDYGRSLRAQSVRQQWHEQLRHFWGEALGQKLFKNLKHNLQQVLFGGLERYIESELFIKNFKSMNSTEWMLYNNMTTEQMNQINAEAAEKARWKLTRPYRYKIPYDLAEGAQKTFTGVKLMVKYFQPYTNYTIRYYNGGDEELPPPTMPAAISYPWPWSDRIAQLRAALVGVMRVEAARNSLANAGQSASSASSDGSSGMMAAETGVRRLIQDESSSSSDADVKHDVEAGSDSNESDGSASNSLSQLDDETKTASIRLLEQLAKEFHFTTGIPRMNAVKDRFSPVVFPSLQEFLNLSVDSNGSLIVVPGEQFTPTTTEADAGHPSLPPRNSSSTTQSAPNFSSREGVYAAAQYFYSFATVESGYVQAKDYAKLKPEAPKMPTDGTILVDDLISSEKVVRLACSAESPCLVRSGVTVYTPKVTSAVVDIFTNVSSRTPADASAQRLKRQDWFMNIFQDAFDAERRVLKSGLVAPSTVWDSCFDRSSDILADTVSGLVNGSKTMALESGSDVEPRVIFESLLDNSSSPLLKGYSHYTMTNHQTRYAIEKAKTVPELAPFTSEQLIYLVGFLAELSGQMEETMVQYERKRDGDPMHIAIVNATREAVYYDGRLFGVLGYGYFLPSTNSENVAYRDHKIPVPFHLIMRVLVRLQESHLLLPEESVHLAACVAMQRFGIRYYRCNEMEKDDKATPKPIQKEPLSSPELTRATKTASISSPAPSPSSQHSVSFDWL